MRCITKTTVKAIKYPMDTNTLNTVSVLLSAARENKNAITPIMEERIPNAKFRLKISVVTSVRRPVYMSAQLDT